MMRNNIFVVIKKCIHFENWKNEYNKHCLPTGNSHDYVKSQRQKYILYFLSLSIPMKNGLILLFYKK